MAPYVGSPTERRQLFVAPYMGSPTTLTQVAVYGSDLSEPCELEIAGTCSWLRIFGAHDLEMAGNSS